MKNTQYSHWYCASSRSPNYISLLVPKFKNIKIDHFGHDLAVLHEHDISRRRKWFAEFNEQKRQRLMEDLGRVIEQTPFQLISIIIDKPALRKQYKKPEHPYHLALRYALERLANFLHVKKEDKLPLTVICEARGKHEDRTLELEFRKVCDGNNFKKHQYPYEIIIADKQCNSEGLQLADLCARPIGLSHLRPEQSNRAYEILRSKFCTNAEGHFDGAGRKVFP